MSILIVLLVLAFVGFVLYLVETKIPMDPIIKRVLEFIVILFVIIWAFQTMGVLGSVESLKIK